MDNLQTTYTTNFFGSPEEHLTYLLTPKPINVRNTIIPYFYVIRSRALDAYYVGIKFSRKNSNPSKFWAEYKTSSKTIKECIEINGPDDFEVINVFDTNPHGNDWDFQRGDGDFRLGQFETDSIYLFENTEGIRIINQRSKFGSKVFNPHAIMPDGRTAGQHRRAKSHEKMIAIDPETGLSIYDTTGMKIKEKLNEIDEETGLTAAQKAGKNSAKTKNKIDEETGLSIAKVAGKKGANTRQTTILESGKTILEQNVEKMIKTKSIVDDETGMSISQSASLKTANKVKTTINPETGLSISQEREIKRRNKMLEVDLKTNKTKLQLTTEKSGITQFNRTIYIYDNTDNLTIVNMYKDLVTFFNGSHGYAVKAIHLYDAGGGLFTFKITSRTKKYEHLNGIEIRTTPKEQQNV